MLDAVEQRGSHTIARRAAGGNEVEQQAEGFRLLRSRERCWRRAGVGQGEARGHGPVLVGGVALLHPRE
eukprot:2783713-Heterocapsa_arctica.AAC.1